MQSFPVYSMRPWASAHDATSFIDARYWRHAEGKTPSWSPKISVSWRGARCIPARLPLSCHERELARDGGQLEQLGEGIAVHLHHGPLCVAVDAVPGLLCVVEVRPGQLDGVFEVLMVGAQEGERGVLLPQQVGGAHGAPPAEADLPEPPDRPPGVDVDASPGLGVLGGVLELVALRRA